MIVNHKILNKIRQEIIEWSEANPRPMPWSGENSPYRIWISEIILQQTRVKQGWNHYIRFIERFPDIESLANADIDEVLKVWEGLGYYSRARNIHYSALQIQSNGGNFPSSYDEILSLKGVGPYTAAAIASFAYNLPYAVVDGNVIRVISRIFGVYENFKSNNGKAQFASIAQDLLDKQNPGFFNQSIMNFGALVCKPIPKCSECSLVKHCYAGINEKTLELPVASMKITKRKRFFLFKIYVLNERVWIRKRENKDIWNGLYEFPAYEFSESMGNVMVSEDVSSGYSQNQFMLKKHTQTLTHQVIEAYFSVIKSKPKPEEIQEKKLKEVSIEELKNYAFPILLQKAITEYLEIAIHL